MAFYIKPPKGNISLDELFHLGKKRLQFLHELCSTSENKRYDLILRTDVLENADCLIEGTALDKVSHFLLKICYGKREMRDFFVQSETILFNFRLQFYNMRNIKETLHAASCEILDLLSRHHFFSEAYKNSLLTIVSVKEQVEEITKLPEINQEIKVPFIHALNFVRERSAHVHQGNVMIKLDQLKSLLTTLFEQNLIESFVHLKSSAFKAYTEEDLRIRGVLRRLQAVFTKLNEKQEKLIISQKRILHSELDQVSQDFPLCMRHLHNILRQRHRLKHKSRIQYTLFLKEIGVPCEEVTKLFEEEYSQVPKHCQDHSTCLHTWAKDRRRYVYGIRHLYGKEGSCNKYRGHSCHTLQCSNVAVSEEGGCPFAQFDREHLKDLLISFGSEVGDIEDLIRLSAEKKYRSACTWYLLNDVKKKVNQETLPNEIKAARGSTPELSPHLSAKNLKDFDTDERTFNTNHKSFTSLSDLILHPSDFYNIRRDGFWMKV